MLGLWIPSRTEEIRSSILLPLLWSTRSDKHPPLLLPNRSIYNPLQQNKGPALNGSLRPTNRAGKSFEWRNGNRASPLMPIQALTKMITSSIRVRRTSPEAEQLTSFDLSLYSFTKKTWWIGISKQMWILSLSRTRNHLARLLWMTKLSV